MAAGAFAGSETVEDESSDPADRVEGAAPESKSEVLPPEPPAVSADATSAEPGGGTRLSSDPESQATAGLGAAALDSN